LAIKTPKSAGGEAIANQGDRWVALSQRRLRHSTNNVRTQIYNQLNQD